MNYKQKYLKYKTKYLNYFNQNAGSQIVIPNELPKTQSWIMMPLLFLPFTDIIIDLPKEIIDSIDKLKIDYKNFEIDIFNITEINNILRDYYISKNVDLNNRRTLEIIEDIVFDDKPNYLHLIGNSQEILLNNTCLTNSIEIIIPHIINEFKGLKFNYTRKDYLYHYKGDQVIRIQSIDKNNYEIYPNLDCLIYNKDNIPSDKSDVLFVFGFLGDTNFAFHKILENFKGLIIYFLDKDNMWYENKFNIYIEIINKYASKFKNYYFFGASMGGYASIYLSLCFPDKNCVCVVISPQILSANKMQNIIIQHDDSPKNKIDLLNNVHTNLLTKLKEKKYTTKIYCLIGKNECTDTGAFFMDQFHIGLIADYDNVNIIITKYSTHSLGTRMHLYPFFTLFDNNNIFDILFNDREAGNKLLLDNIKTR